MLHIARLMRISRFRSTPKGGIKHLYLLVLLIVMVKHHGFPPVALFACAACIFLSFWLSWESVKHLFECNCEGNLCYISFGAIMSALLGVETVFMRGTHSSMSARKHVDVDVHCFMLLRGCLSTLYSTM